MKCNFIRNLTNVYASSINESWNNIKELAIILCRKSTGLYFTCFFLLVLSLEVPLRRLTDVLSVNIAKNP